MYVPTTRRLRPSDSGPALEHPAPIFHGPAPPPPHYRDPFAITEYTYPTKELANLRRAHSLESVVSSASKLPPCPPIMTTQSMKDKTRHQIYKDNMYARVLDRSIREELREEQEAADAAAQHAVDLAAAHSAAAADALQSAIAEADSVTKARRIFSEAAAANEARNTLDLAASASRPHTPAHFK